MSARELHCSKCLGEGQIFTSRYGGNDPDVWSTGKCPACDGSGRLHCEERGCEEEAIGFDDDGNALCGECLARWMENYGGEP